MTLERICTELRALALEYPGAVPESPWGDWVAKVGGKIFAFVSVHDGDLLVTAKLPRSGLMALGLAFAKPTGYGLGKHGWVSARFSSTDEVPVPMLHEWLDESYRAVAPKRILATLDGALPPARPTGAARKSTTGTKGRAGKR